MRKEIETITREELARRICEIRCSYDTDKDCQCLFHMDCLKVCKSLGVIEETPEHPEVCRFTECECEDCVLREPHEHRKGGEGETYTDKIPNV